MDFSPPYLSKIPPSSHGALDYAELERAGIRPENVIDFSVNSNPFGPSPMVREAIEKTPPDRYPDRECLALRRTLAERWAVASTQIVVGNGTAELIWLSAFAFLKPGENVLIIGPTFGEYERVVRLMSAKPVVWNTLPTTGFACDPTEISQLLSSSDYRVVFLCNPNNPTGQVIAPDVILALVDAHPCTLFIVDEAYLAFVPGLGSVILNLRPNLLVFRSMTKDYALAGLRLGYAIGEVRLIDALTNVRPAWNVNSLAQAAGLAALNDTVYYQTSLNHLGVEKEFLLAGLVTAGFIPVQSHTHFFLLPVGSATCFRQNLLHKGILVRDCSSFGLPEYVRISPRIRSENQQLLNWLQKSEQLSKPQGESFCP